MEAMQRPKGYNKDVRQEYEWMPDGKGHNEGTKIYKTCEFL